jgi:hypothetical protein
MLPSELGGPMAAVLPELSLIARHTPEDGNTQNGYVSSLDMWVPFTSAWWALSLRMEERPPI